MKTFLAFVLVFGLCGGIAQAEKLRAIVTGPSSAISGQMITLSAKDSEGNPNKFSWSISPIIASYKQLKFSDDKSECVVASFPGTYIITLAVANDEEIDLTRWQLTIPGTAPCPVPDGPPDVVPTPFPVPPVPTPPVPTPVPPTPTPTPSPAPTPSDRLGFFANVRDEVKKINDPVMAAQLASRSRAFALIIRQREAERAKAVANGKPEPAAISFNDGLKEIATGLKAAGEKWLPLLRLTPLLIQTLLAEKKLDVDNIMTIVTLLEELADALEAATK